MLERFSGDAKRVLVAAQEAARVAGDDRIGVLHLLYGLTSCGDAISSRVTALGLTAELVRARIPPLATEPLPEPMDDIEARRLHRELRGRGISSAKAAQLVARIQAQRLLGPVELSPGATRAVEGALRRDGGVGTAQLWAELLASPPSEVVELAAEAGTTLVDLRRSVTPA